MRRHITCLAAGGALALAALIQPAPAQDSNATIIITNEEVKSLDEGTTSALSEEAIVITGPGAVAAQPAPADTWVITNEDVDSLDAPSAPDVETSDDTAKLLEELAKTEAQRTADEQELIEEGITIPITPTPEPSPTPRVTTIATPTPKPPTEVTFTVNGKPGFTSKMVVMVNPEDEVSIEPTAPDTEGLGLLTPPAQLSLAPKKFAITQNGEYAWNVSAGRVVKFLDRGIIWESPLRSGAETIELQWLLERTLVDQTTPEVRRDLHTGKLQGTNTLTALVRYPFSAADQTSIEGYAIGVYADPDMPNVADVSPFVAENKDRYRPPQWFVKVDAKTALMNVSPHFTLGDFSPALDRGKTHFIALDYRLVDRLEALLKKVQEKHPQVKSLRILRAFLSPVHRDLYRVRGIDITTFSRYLYGDAAVIIVDADNNGVMDDLNGDGQSNIGDAEWLETLLGDLERESGVYGGVGVMDKFDGPEHETATPCVMIDTRGVRSRWRVAE